MISVYCMMILAYDFSSCFIAMMMQDNPLLSNPSGIAVNSSPSMMISGGPPMQRYIPVNVHTPPGLLYSNENYETNILLHPTWLPDHFLYASGLTVLELIGSELSPLGVRKGVFATRDIVIVGEKFGPLPEGFKNTKTTTARDSPTQHHSNVSIRLTQ